MAQIRTSGYTPYSVRYLLDNYEKLVQGELPIGELEIRVRKPFPHAPYETAKLIQSDLDNAIQNLGHRARFVIVACNVAGYGIESCAYWLGGQSRDVAEIENKAIRRMVNFLNDGVKSAVS